LSQLSVSGNKREKIKVAFFGTTQNLIPGITKIRKYILRISTTQTQNRTK